MTVQITDLTPEQLAEAYRLYLEKNPPKPPEGQDESTLPQWARDAITRGNTEAAGFRTKLREAEEKLSNAKTPEDIAAATKEWQEKFEAAERKASEVALDAARTVAKVTHGLTDRVAGSLKGTTAEEIEADAKAWAEELGTLPKNDDTTRRTRTPGGGLGGGGSAPGAGSESYDPAALALEVEKASGRR